MTLNVCAGCGRDMIHAGDACPHCGARRAMPPSPPDFGSLVFNQSSRSPGSSLPKTGWPRWTVPAAISIAAGMLAIIVIVSLIQVGTKVARDRAADEAALREIRAAVDARKASLNGQLATDAPIATRPTNEGTLLQRAAAIMTKFQRQATAADNAYLQSLTELQLEQVLSPQRLTSREGIERNRIALDKANASLRTYIAANDARLIAFEAEVMGLKDARGFTAFMRGFEAQRQQTYERNTRTLLNQQRTFDAASAVTEFMAGRIHSAQAEGDAIAFQTDHEVAEYNRLIDEVQASVAEEARIRAETLAALDKQVDKARIPKNVP